MIRTHKSARNSRHTKKKQTYTSGVINIQAVLGLREKWGPESVTRKELGKKIIGSVV